MLQGGGERYVARHHERGKLLVRDRVDLLVDQDSWFLDLSQAQSVGRCSADAVTLQYGP